MTIASQITRLQWAKSSIKTSIQNKWVTVPNNAKIDTYASYIDQIEYWWAAGIIGNKVLRAGTYYVWKNQTISSQVHWLSYITWDYMFLLSWFPRWRDDHWTLIMTMWVAFTPTAVDYIQSSFEDWDPTSSSHPDRSFVWLRISESWNIVTLESCYSRWYNQYYPEYWKYWFHTTWTFNKNTNTFWQWSLEYQQTVDNPYFSWLIWDQWYYTVSMERLWSWDSSTVQKRTPTFN